MSQDSICLPNQCTCSGGRGASGEGCHSAAQLASFWMHWSWWVYLGLSLAVGKIDKSISEDAPYEEEQSMRFRQVAGDEALASTGWITMSIC